MNTEYTIDYFLKKFKKIPNNKWLEGSYHNPEKTKFCALGHCGVDVGTSTGEGFGIMDFLGDEYAIAQINDGFHRGYHQKTPRLRILAALRKIKKDQG